MLIKSFFFFYISTTTVSEGRHALWHCNLKRSVMKQKTFPGRLVEFSLYFNKKLTLCAQYRCQVVASLVKKFCHSNKMTSVAAIRWCSLYFWLDKRLGKTSDALTKISQTYRVYYWMFRLSQCIPNNAD